MEENKEKQTIVPVIGINMSKPNVVTGYYANEKSEIQENLPVVHGEIRVEVDNNCDMFLFVLISKMNPDGLQQDNKILSDGLEREIVIEFSKVNKNTIFLDADTKDVYTLSNKPSFSKPLGKAISKIYEWDKELSRIIKKENKVLN